MPAECALTEETRDVYGDIVSQAVTGEFIGMLNFASLVDLYDGIDEKVEALNHAQIEKAHALAFKSAAAELGIPVLADLNAPYWSRIRSSFLRRARSGDLAACILIQEVMLETFAISIYRQVGDVAPGRLGATFARIAREEAEHLEHALPVLEECFARDPEALEAKVCSVHEEVMTTLAEMVSRRCSAGHCGLCRNTCVKEQLGAVGLDIARFRGGALREYLTTLDRLGIRGDRSLQWVARLPL